jgi:hypothetical protein
MMRYETIVLQSKSQLALKLYSWCKLNVKTMFTLILFLGTVFTSDGQPAKLLTDSPINLGEKLEFKMSYGWFTVGKAIWSTEKSFQDYNGEKCYHFKVTAKSAGFLGSFAQVDDVWGEYMRPDFIPMMAYRDLEEGKYVLDEKSYFDYGTRKIKTEVIRKGNKKPDAFFDMDKERLAMLGGFMRMRCIDYAKYKPGDHIKIEAFFEGEPYELDVIYKGKEELKSKVGRIQSYKLSPILPENRLFPGKEPITVWISADKNRLPLRADANMYFGTAYVEMTGYKNVKFGPDYR